MKLRIRKTDSGKYYVQVRKWLCWHNLAELDRKNMLPRLVTRHFDTIGDAEKAAVKYFERKSKKKLPDTTVLTLSLP